MTDPADPSFDRRRPFLAHRLRDRYEFINLLGRGGTGAVYEVRNLRLDRIEALKVLGESLEGEAAERFAHEAKVAASLNHPRIVKIHDFGMEEGIHWYSMDLVDGPTLEGLLKAHGPFELSTFARAILPVLDALEHAHGLGIIHRDLKPANILLNHEGRPHLADFGVAKSKESLLKTQTGLFLGTPAYIAPEQALTGGADLRADIYSMGALIYHILSGQLPFQGDTPLQIVVARLDKDPVPLQQVRPGLPTELAAIVATAMARDRDLRYESAGRMRDALRSFCQDAGWPGKAPLPASPFPPAPGFPCHPCPWLRNRRPPVRRAGNLQLPGAGPWASPGFSWWPDSGGAGDRGNFLRPCPWLSRSSPRRSRRRTPLGPRPGRPRRRRRRPPKMPPGCRLPTRSWSNPSRRKETPARRAQASGSSSPSWWGRTARCRAARSWPAPPPPARRPPGKRPCATGSSRPWIPKAGP